ncbi:hypothetical protein ScPMuIL_010645 [Solemya velum]
MCASSLAGNCVLKTKGYNRSHIRKSFSLDYGGSVDRQGNVVWHKVSCVAEKTRYTHTQNGKIHVFFH